MTIAVNAVASTAGGGKTYLKQLVRWMIAHPENRYEVWVPRPAAGEFGTTPAHIKVHTSRLAHWTLAGRMLWEQVIFPFWLRRTRASVAYCVGNVCPLWSSTPVVLLSANALYFSERFSRELLRRRHLAWAVKHLARGFMAVRSALAADAIITPTRAMGDYLGKAAGGRELSLRVLPFGHHGPAAESGRSGPEDAEPFRFLMVSFYNYFRNFETVFRAMHRLRQNTDRVFRLTISTQLEPGLRLGGYDTTEAYHLAEELGLREIVERLGHVPYERIAELYSRADALICSGYVESFSFTLVEGMASGTPVLASDIPAHREVGGEAALFFEPMDADELASQCLRLMEDEQLRGRMRQQGLREARKFDWNVHFEQAFRALEEVAA